MRARAADPVDQNVDGDPDRWVQASCFLCSNGCGIDIGVKDDQPGGRIVGVRGREADTVNRGRLGPKGLYARVANASPDRLTHPLVRRGDRFEQRAHLLVIRGKAFLPRRIAVEHHGFRACGGHFRDDPLEVIPWQETGRTAAIDFLPIGRSMRSPMRFSRP